MSPVGNGCSADWNETPASAPPERMPRVPNQSHEMNWVNAIKGTDTISCPFSYAAHLTEIMLLGVEEPRCLIHAPNESVYPSEIEHIALAEAMFLQGYADTQST